MEELRIFLNFPNLTIRDAQKNFGLSKYIQNRRIRRILGLQKLTGSLSNEKLRNLSVSELIKSTSRLIFQKVLICIVRGQYCIEILEMNTFENYIF